MRVGSPVACLALVGVFAACSALAGAGARAADLADVVEKVEPSAVRIDTNRGIGSGVVIDDKGRVITNYHVIDGARAAKVKFQNGRVAQVTGYVAIDASRDLALLQIENAKLRLSPIAIADKLPRKGERVAAFGNPQGLSFSTSEGIVSAIRSGAELSRLMGSRTFQAFGYSTSSTWIQTTAAISGGNSGGPLVDMEGKLLGLNTLSQADGQNLNFAISAADIKRFIDGAPKGSTLLLSNLPRRPTDISTHEKFKLEMPSGRVFTFDTFGRTSLAITPETGERTLCLRHLNDKPAIVAEHVNGKLHGRLIEFSESFEPLLLATYEHGARSGLQRTWTESGGPEILLQYLKGKRTGFGLYFEESHLRLIVEYDHDVVKGIQLMDELTPGRAFASPADAEKDEGARGLLKGLADKEFALKRREVALKKELADAYREYRHRNPLPNGRGSR